MKELIESVRLDKAIDDYSSLEQEKMYIDYLNEIGECLPEEEFIIGGKDRTHLGLPYGVLLKKFDPIAFNVGFRDYINERKYHESKG